MPTSSTMSKPLPADFAELAPFLDWSVATETERYTKRLVSSMDDMQSFYDAAFPRLRDAIAYCNGFTLSELPDEARTLMHLMQSLITVSFPVEVWKQARVPDSGAAYLKCIREPVI